MKFNKYFAMAAFIAAAALTACDDEEAFEPGAPAGQYDVSFVDPGNVVVALTASSFDITLTRSNASGELTVPLEVVSDAGFSIPTSATFASGADKASVTIGLPSEMALNTTYNVVVRIPEEYTNPYKAETLYPLVSIPVLKEDYEVFKKGSFTDTFWYEDTWEVTVEYSPSQDLYRIKDLLTEGYNLFFVWNHETNVIQVTNASGTPIKYWETGLWLSSYSSYIVCYVNQAKFFYDPTDNYMYLPFYWYMLGIGGWGIYPAYLEF